MSISSSTSTPFPAIPSFIVSTILAFVPTVMAGGSTAPSSIPQVDFGKMGTVGLGGSFSGLDWYSSDSPFASSSSSSSSSTQSFSSKGDTLFYRTEDGIFRALGSTNDGGIINSLCWSSSPDSSNGNGTLFIGGTFTSLSGVSANNVGSFSLSTNTFSALSSGLSGNVNTLYCDDDNSEIWFGGSFNAPTGQGGNVALWSTSSSAWTEPSFGGLNGVVQSIAPSSDQKSLYFGGDFTTTYLSTSSLNSTSRTNITSQPNAPVNTTTVGQSGYLTPLTISASASDSAQYQIQAGPSSSLNQDGQNYGDTNGLLCPGTSTWLAQENTISNVNLVGDEYLPATGVRMVNGHENGRSTTYFCFTSLPDYQELNMTYTDPKTGKNETCTDHCPLSTDSSIAAQDFIFTQGTHNLTGFEIQLKQWTGDGAALSSVSLLTDGAYSSATGAGASSTCSSGKNSTVQSVGDWSTKTAATDSATESYLSSSVSTRDPTDAQVTFYPYVGSAGQYDIYVFIPGCKNIGDCDGRTSVDIEVFPLQGGLGWTSTISEQVDYDTKTLVYSGPVDATTDAFTPTLSLALAANPAAPARGNNYVVVADRIQLVLTGITDSTGSIVSTSSSSSNGTSTSGNSITNTTSNSTYNVAYGVFEYARSSNSSLNAATSSLTNDTETALTRLGFGLDAALNASGSAASSWIVNTIVAANNTVFVGGDFSASNNFTNVISIDTSSGQASALASQGLSGVVNTAAVVGGYVFFGGDFTSTASSGGVALNYIARYDPSLKAWAALGGGVDGYVTDLLASTASTNELIVMGNFSHIVSSNGTSTGTGGYAVYDVSTSEWINTGIVFGNVSAGAVPSSSSGVSSESFFAGKVYGTAGNSVGGVATLSTNDNGDAVISSLNGVNFGTSGSAPVSSSSPSSRRRSSIVARASHSYTRSWLARYTDAIVERAHTVLSSRATPPTIPSQTSQAPAVLAGAFWTNSSASGKPTITILGGNFTSSSGDVQGLAFYNEKDGGLTGPSTALEGVVKTLNVIGNNVYIGGEALNVQNVGSGLMVYDLKAGNWVTGGMAALNPPSGSDNVTVNAIRTRGDTNTVVVAGNFGTAGSLGCAAVCLWDSKDAQWSTPGSGLSGGEVRAVDFAGDSSDTLIAAGSFALSSGDVAYVASYSFTNSSWTPLGTLPGPALAIAVDDKNSSNIFAAGYSTSDGSSYLQQWNGATWTAQSESLAPGSLVSQLAFVPMKSEHDPQGSIESDRMLMISGDLYLENSGNVTSALYDGSTFYPYLVGTSSSGDLGAGSSLFWSESDFSFKVRHYLARGLVVLVAIAIATGLILLLVLIVLLLTFCFRRRERKEQNIYNDQKEVGSDGDVDSTHQNVFNNVQAALEASLIGGGLAGAGAAAATNKQNRVSDPSSYNSGAYPIGSDAEEYPQDEDEELEEDGRETTMRYDFDGPDLQEGELPMKAGQRVIIVDDEQSTEWWFVRDPLTGREGVVPATYVW